MTTQSPSIAPGIADISARRTAPSGDSSQGLIAEIVTFCREFAQTAFTSYHPERHYMRGPGPACAAKRARRD